jgi:hypothetical protein
MQMRLEPLFVGGVEVGWSRFGRLMLEPGVVMVMAYSVPVRRHLSVRNELVK